MRRSIWIAVAVVGLGWVINYGFCTERVALTYCTVCLPENPGDCAKSLTDALKLTTEDAARQDARQNLCYATGKNDGVPRAGCMESPLEQFRSSCETRVVSRPRYYLGPH